MYTFVYLIVYLTGVFAITVHDQVHERVQDKVHVRVPKLISLFFKKKVKSDAYFSGKPKRRLWEVNHCR